MKKYNILLLWVFILAYIFYFGLISVLKFRSFAYYDFDLAVHDLSVWNILHGSTYNSILGISFLGNHLHLILFPVAIIYAIFSHPLTLLILQTLALGLAALPLYRLAVHLLDEKWAIIISLIYLFYPALGYTNLFEFHPTAFATFFLAMSVYYFELHSFKKFLIFIGLSMLCQENIPLAVIMLGVLALIQRRDLKWILIPLIGGIVYFFAALLLMRYFNKDTVQFFSLYHHLGNTPVEIFLNIFTRPKLLFNTLTRLEVFVYLVHIFLPLAFLPILSPLQLLPALPLFAQHLLSSRHSDLSIFYHYTAELIPFLFVSFIYSLRSVLKNNLCKRYESKLKILLLGFLAVGNLFFGPHRLWLSKLPQTFKKDYLDDYKEKFIAQIPKDASVVATFELLSHLSHRKRLFSLHHQYIGFYTLSNKRYALPDDVEYALVDFNDSLTFAGFYRPDRYKNLQGFFAKGNFKIIGLVDSLALLKKATPSEEGLCSMVKESGLNIENKVKINVENSLQLIGYDLKRNRQDSFLETTFYYRCLNPTEQDINIFLDVVDENQALLMRKDFPVCYRIFPTQSWQKGQVFKDHLRLYLPPRLLEKRYQLKIGFFDYRSGIICKVQDQDALGRVRLSE